MQALQRDTGIIGKKMINEQAVMSLGLSYRQVQPITSVYAWEYPRDNVFPFLSALIVPTSSPPPAMMVSIVLNVTITHKV